LPLAERTVVSSSETSSRHPRRLRPQMKVKIFFGASLESFAAKRALR
jgi:hypothetical protein